MDWFCVNLISFCFEDNNKVEITNEILWDFYYKYCSIKSTGWINCTGFLLRVLLSEVWKVLIAKSTVFIKSTGFEFENLNS